MAGGEQVEKECSEYIQQHGVVKMGTAGCMTSAGDMPCRHIIHTVGPQWRHYKDKSMCLKKLTNAYLNCLRRAEDEGYESIAFPVISSGE